MDAITALLSGDTLTDDQKMKQTADALRGQQRAGDFFSMSTIAPLQQLGQQTSQDAMKAARAGGVRREAALRRAQQMQMEKERRKAAEALNLTRFNQQKELAELKQNLKDGDKGAGGLNIKDLPVAQQKAYVTAQQIVTDFPDLVERVSKNEGAFGLDDNPTALLPGFTPNLITKPAKAWEASTLSDEEEQVKSAVFKNAYDIIHELAGATLAMGEEDKISKFLPMPEDSTKTIMNKLRNAEAEAKRVLSNLGNIYGTGGATTQQPPQEVSTATAAPQGMTPEQQQYWNELTPQQQAEYLKLKRGAGK
jgi:hypothetical protein